MDCAKKSFVSEPEIITSCISDRSSFTLTINDGVFEKSAFPTNDFKVITVFMLNYTKMSKDSIIQRAKISLREDIND